MFISTAEVEGTQVSSAGVVHFGSRTAAILEVGRGVRTTVGGSQLDNDFRTGLQRGVLFAAHLSVPESRQSGKYLKWLSSCQWG